MNMGTLNSRLPARESENARTTVTAGLAELVDQVKKYAAAIFAPKASAARCCL